MALSEALIALLMSTGLYSQANAETYTHSLTGEQRTELVKALLPSPEMPRSFRASRGKLAPTGPDIPEPNGK